MRHIRTIFSAGIILVLMPLLGFPNAWKSFISVILGLLLCVIAISTRRGHRRASHSKEKKAEAVTPTPAPAALAQGESLSKQTPVVPPSAIDHEQAPQV